MIKVWLGQYTKVGTTLIYPDVYFEHAFNTENLSTSFSKKLLKTCANATVLHDDILKIKGRRSHYTALSLPSSVKATLLAVYNPEVILGTLHMSNDCISFLVEASKECDITVFTPKCINFFDPIYSDSDIMVMVMNTDTLYTEPVGYLEACSIYGYDWLEDTPDGLILHPEHLKPKKERNRSVYPVPNRDFLRIERECYDYVF